jgi:hypothetical protein
MGRSGFETAFQKGSCHGCYPKRPEKRRAEKQLDIFIDMLWLVFASVNASYSLSTSQG